MTSEVFHRDDVDFSALLRDNTEGRERGTEREKCTHVGVVLLLLPAAVIRVRSSRTSRYY